MAGHDKAVVKPAMRWETLGEGGDLWATVVMASGFVLPPGQEVREHYRILRTLGEGGMGQVLAVALAGSADTQTYALKMVARPAIGAAGQPTDPADRRDAERQATAFAALLRGEAAKQELVQRHGVSVARLFALVRFEDGSLGLRMDVARGRSLEAYIETESRERADQAPDVDFWIVVMRKLLYQLRRLHELVDPSSPSGFVHSDVKPGNVFVDDGDRFDPLVTLLDFGVATAGHALGIDRAANSGGRKSLVLHDAGGTFGYAPPHHFTGKPTPLSDTYAALVILYEMIALRSPWKFDGMTRTADNLFKLEDAMRAGPRPIRSARPSIPVDTADVLDRFFADEFRSLQELADTAHTVRSTLDEPVRQAMGERVRTLAGGYQEKLEALRTQLAGGTIGRDATLLSAVPLHTDSTPSIPREARITRVEIPSGRRAIDREPPPVLPVRPLIGWKTFTFLLLVAAAGVFVWLRGVPRPLERIFREIVARTLPDTRSSQRATHSPTDAASTTPIDVVAASALDAVSLAAAAVSEDSAGGGGPVDASLTNAAAPIDAFANDGALGPMVAAIELDAAGGAVAERGAHTLAAAPIDASAGGSDARGEHDARPTPRSSDAGAQRAPGPPVAARAGTRAATRTSTPHTTSPTRRTATPHRTTTTHRRPATTHRRAPTHTPRHPIRTTRTTRR